eukprot:6208364-Pleurochrysis_carterae.AAC.5
MICLRFYQLLTICEPQFLESLRLENARMAMALASLQQHCERVAAVVDEVVGEGGRERHAAWPCVTLRCELIRPVLLWASGESFEASWQRCAGEVYEGTLVRAFRALDQFLGEIAKAAATLGDTPLAQKVESCMDAVHRGLPFAPSLFVADD